MTQNIGKFTNAGLSLKTSVAAIQGVANVAAVSGANSNEASRAMYNFAQALSKGYVQLIDWKSIELANMGTVEFKQQLIDAAAATGTLTKKGKEWVTSAGTSVSATKNFNDSLTDQWLTTEVLTDTLGKYSDKTTAIGKKAFAAAQDVKTFTQLIDTMKEAVGSGWATTFEIIIGDFDEAKKLWTGVNNVVGTWIDQTSDARNKLLADWDALGGRDAAIKAISNAFHALLSVLKPIGDAFRSIFPKKTGRDLFNITKAIEKFTESLIVGSETADQIKRIFAGFFAVLGIGWEVIKGVAGVLGDLFGVVSGGSGGFLEAAAGIGDFLVGLHEAVKNGEGLKTFFEGLSSALQKPVKLLSKVGDLLANLFGGLGNVDTGGINDLSRKLNPLGKIGDALVAIFQRLTGLFSKLMDLIKPLAAKFGEFAGAIGEKLAEVFGSNSYSGILDTINTALLGGIVLLIKKFLKNGFSVDVGGPGLFGGILDALKGVSGVLKAMQQNLKANVLLKIAGAIALLTVSVVALSMIDSEALTKALTAITVMFVQLGTAMAVLEKISLTKSAGKMTALGAAMILFAIAIDILAIAVKSLSELSWEELAKGLAGVTALLGALVAVSKGMDKNAGGMIRSGAAMILLAAGIKILVSAVTDLSGLSWEEMAKGLVGVGTLLAALTLFTRMGGLDKGGLMKGAGLLLLAAGIKVLASAVKDFSSLSWEDMARGLVGLAGALVVISAAIKLMPATAGLKAAGVLVISFALGMIADAMGAMGKMSWGAIAKGIIAMAGALDLISAALSRLPPSSLLSAAAIFVVASSLGMIADALGDMGGMTWEEIGKGLLVLAASLGILAGAVYLMEGGALGAVAIALVAAALALLVPVLIAMGQMSMAEIGKSLLMLAGTFVVLGLAALVLTPVIPLIAALAIAVGILGGGMLAAGLGVLAFATALTILGASSTVAIAGITALVTAVINLMPKMAIALAEALVAFVVAIGNAAPQIVEAIVKVLVSLMDAVIELSPKIGETLMALLDLLLEILVQAIPDMVTAGCDIVIGILNGIAEKVPLMARAATDLIIELINAIADNVPDLADAGAKAIIKLVNGISDAIDNNAEEMGRAGGRLATSIIKGMASGLLNGVREVAGAARDLASRAYEAAKNFLKINSPSKKFAWLGEGTGEGFVKGMDAMGHVVEKSSENMGQTAIDQMRKTISGMGDLVKGMDATPVIRPVVDLSDVKASGEELQRILGKTPTVKVSTSGRLGRQVQAQVATNVDAAAAQAIAVPAAPTVVEMTQNNYSPKALSAATIYRQTNNQISVVKGALSNT